MDYNTMVVAPAIAAFLSSFTMIFLQEFVWQKKAKKRQIKDDAMEQEGDRMEQTLLILKSLNAIGKLTRANSIALQDGKTNGELKEAMKEFEEMDSKMYDYLVTHGLR